MIGQVLSNNKGLCVCARVRNRVRVRVKIGVRVSVGFKVGVEGLSSMRCSSRNCIVVHDKDARASKVDTSTPFR